MEKIASFKINHLKLKKGLYVSRVDKQGNTIVTTFDLRMAEPYNEQPMDMSAIHTIEHLGATFFRNSDIKEDVIYFGPMGCRTGFYLVLFGEKTPQDIYPKVLEMCDYILSFEGEIPGATKIECGNYLEQDLPKAKVAIMNYVKGLLDKNFEYLD